MTAAFATDLTKDIGEAMALVRKSSSAPDEEMVDLTVEALKEPVLEKKTSNVPADITLNKLMEGGLGVDILMGTDMSQLCINLITLVSQIIQRKQFTLEDKIIVENAMALWTGCVLYESKLFKEFVEWKNVDQASGIKITDDFVLGGLLLCPEEKIRLDFQNTFSSLSQHFSTGDNSALIYLLGLLAKNFSMITDRPARQFFDLFNELIALNAEYSWMIEDQSAIYDPEDMLRQIIAKIKATSEKKRQGKIKTHDGGDEPMEETKEEVVEELDELKVQEKAAEEERMLVGLISLTEKILRNVEAEVSAKIVEEQNLI